MTRWLLVITWVAMIFYHIGAKDSERKLKPDPLGYYEIEYLNGEIKAYYVDIRSGEIKDSTVEDVEYASGMKFPKYRVIK
jgi:hypothetical protein